MSIHVIPQIFITLASPKLIEQPPYSPFTTWLSPLSDEDDDTKFRRNYLCPPPRPLDSPRLRPTFTFESPVLGEGLERQQFERLLKLTASGSVTKKPNDLRKEIALRAHHQARHEHRRALFLEKLTAPPSAIAMFTPNTPPESPGIFHYSLPSPGLTSPLAIFDQLESPVREHYMVEVDYRRLGGISPNDKPAHRMRVLPSLQEITARMNSVSHTVILSPSLSTAATMVDRLPAFLRPQPMKPDRLPAFLRPQPMKPLPTTPTSAAKTEVTIGAPRLLPLSPAKFEFSETTTARSTTGMAMLAKLNRRTGDQRNSSPAERHVFANEGFAHPVLDLPGAL